jgi:hypothetical protein
MRVAAMQGNAAKTMLIFMIAKLLVRSHAYAQDSSGLELSWDVPAECAEREAGVRSGLARQLESSRARGARITISVERQADGSYLLLLDMRVGSNDSHRELRSESCHAAVDAATLLSGLALVRTSAAPAPAEPSVAEPVRFELAVAAALLLRTLPGVSPGGVLQLGLAWHELHAFSAVGYFPPRNAESAIARAQIELLTLELGACYLHSLAPLALGACARVGLGRLAGAGRGVDAASPGSARLQLIGGSIQVRGEVAAPLWVFADAGLTWNQRRPRFAVRGAGTIHAPDALAARFLVGAMIELR